MEESHSSSLGVQFRLPIPWALSRRAYFVFVDHYICKPLMINSRLLVFYRSSILWRLTWIHQSLMDQLSLSLMRHSRLILVLFFLIWVRKLFSSLRKNCLFGMRQHRVACFCSTQPPLIFKSRFLILNSCFVYWCLIKISVLVCSFQEMLWFPSLCKSSNQFWFFFSGFGIVHDTLSWRCLAYKHHASSTLSVPFSTLAPKQHKHWFLMRCASRSFYYQTHLWSNKSMVWPALRNPHSSCYQDVVQVFFTYNNQ